MTKAKFQKRRPLTVIFENARWLFIYKPPGIPVHGGAGKSSQSILDRLLEERGQPFFLVHRLDRPTAGVLMLAKTKEGASEASQHWANVSKTYQSLCFGRLSVGMIDESLIAPDGRKQEARTRVTEVETLVRGPFELSLCTLVLETGRFHQIRRHLSGRSHPIVGDDKYGDFEANKRWNQHLSQAKLPKTKHPFLACMALSFPRSMDLPTLRADRPKSWEMVLQYLGAEQ